MLTAQEAREKLQTVLSNREARIRAWVEDQLPSLQKAILDAIGNARDTVHVNVDIHPTYECDSPASYLSALIRTLEDHKYTVSNTGGPEKFPLTISWAEKTKAYR